MSAVEFHHMIVSNKDFLKPFAFTLTKDNETAKDLMQETLYKALANRDKYHVGTNIKAWLYTIMRNIFINDYRRKEKQQTIFDSSANHRLINSPVSIATNSAESNFQFKIIQQAIHDLPELFKLPFILYFEGFKYNEIARLLNEPLGTIKSRIHFARKLLREQLTRQ